MKLTKILMSLVAIAIFAATANTVLAGDATSKHKVVIQVNTNDPATQNLALNNAVNLQKHYGIDQVDVEIVAYGPGLVMLTKNAKNKAADRVVSLAASDIHFSACGNTMKKMAKKSGKEPVLLKGVNKVPAGVARIMELQEQGYAYIRP